MKMRPISGWVRMTILFTIAGFFEVAAYGQVSAFTGVYLPHLGIEAAAVAFWVGAITSFSNFAGLRFLPFWGALAGRYACKQLIIGSCGGTLGAVCVAGGPASCVVHAS